MTGLVFDASVVLKWFRREGEVHREAALALRAAFATGRMIVFAPALLYVEILNVAGRQWLWSEVQLARLATGIHALGFETRDPDLESVARWVARGLTAYDAAYVAVAETENLTLVTDDPLILEKAASHATALAVAAAAL